MKLKLIRYEVVNDINPKLNCGLFVFPYKLLNTKILSQEDIDRFNDLQSQLTEPEPDIPDGASCVFYFTEKGFMQFRDMPNIIEKALLPIFEMRQSYLEIDSSDPRIIYQDEWQVAVLSAHKSQ